MGQGIKLLQYYTIIQFLSKATKSFPFSFKLRVIISQISI